MYYCGIDIAKHAINYLFLDDAGDYVLSMHFANSQKGLEKLLDAFVS